MRKSILSALGLVIVATVTSAALAQDAVIFLDIRDNSAATGVNALSNTPTTPLTNVPNLPGGGGGVNSGRRGAGQILRLCPAQADGFETNPGFKGWPNNDGDANRATGKLWLYMDVIDNASLGNELVSSLGLDMDIIAAGTLQRQVIGSLAFTLDNDNKVLNSITPPAGTAGPWNNKLNGTVAVAWPNSSVTGIKAVAIPVSAGPTYDVTNRLVPNTAVAGGLHGEANVAPYRLGHLDVTAGLRSCTGLGGTTNATNSKFNVFLKGNNLLTTRVTQTGTNPGDVQIAFGYNAGVLDPNISGNVIGVASATPDATIILQLPGDWNGSGGVTNVDTAGQLAAIPQVDGEDNAFLGDFNESRTVTNTDTAAYLLTIGLEGNTSCP